MDTSFWKNLSPNIDLQESTKQFYNQYYFRLDIHAPGCKSIRCENVSYDIERRRTWVRDYRRQGSWWNKQLAEYLKEADIGFLTSLKDLYYEYPDVKIRTEEPKISVYATDELVLQSVAKSIDPDHRDKLTSITGPASEEIKAMLDKHVILVKKPPKYKYRVWLREKQFDVGVRHQVLAYLDSLGDLVRISDHSRDNLAKEHNWIWGSNFYTNDRHVATFLTLIHPDLIREVSELVCLDNK
jgi:hypothetical protein